MNRHWYGVLLLLLVVTGNVLVGVHAATHVASSLGECELCAAYNDPSDAIPVENAGSPPVVRQAETPEVTPSLGYSTAVVTARQRAPPA